ncbi:hypothetical protein [Acidicapsa ligni]|uniref:hypothetical protein n=1 Tax=Acidicapsa ligni TaxID=542300 RepID=UPI0021E0C29C|nr:hypothetical protein [Acidicapsa ligni]
MFKGIGKQWLKRLAGVSVVTVMMLMIGSGVMAQAQAGATVLTAAEASKLLPASVYFRGQSATTQLRNSGGVKFGDGMLVLATVVDTSGYATDVKEKYQSYFITEVPLKIEGQTLPAGIYGVGFIANDKFVVLDVGAHDLLAVGAHKDADLKRPMPLKITAAADGFRLYMGRSYITFSK